MPRSPGSEPSKRLPQAPATPPSRSAHAQTVPVQQGRVRSKLPHERDESSGAGSVASDQDSGERAYEDASSERVDTDCARSGRTDCPRNPTGRT